SVPAAAVLTHPAAVTYLPVPDARPHRRTHAPPRDPPAPPGPGGIGRRREDAPEPAAAAAAGAGARITPPGRPGRPGPEQGHLADARAPRWGLLPDLGGVLLRAGAPRAGNLRGRRRVDH